jgi:uncharacterized membrane-anchored protein YjiN (DUF445 family)
MDADRRRLRDLRRMKALATGLLAVAAAVYLATPGGTGVLGFVNSAAEAAMVGAAADWFAVTALFRRPMGLPVPHTAIIPTRKDALGRSLQDFVATNFLAEQVVRDRIAGAQVASRAGDWLSRPANAERVAAELGAAARGALEVLRDDEVATLLDEVVLRPVLRYPWGPPAGRLLEQVVADGTHRRLVDLAFDELHRWLLEHEDLVTGLVQDRAPSWTPIWLDERIARRAYQEAVTWASDVRADPQHRVRVAVDDVLGRFAKDLQTDPVTIQQAGDVQQRLLEHPGVKAGLEAVWSTTRRVLVEASEDPDSHLRRRAAGSLASFGRRLGSDARLAATVDKYVEDGVGHLVTTYRDEVATVISDTVRRWDGAEASRRIELHVGRDLQFIRINGTVVGALVGLLIHAVTVLVG